MFFFFAPPTFLIIECIAIKQHSILNSMRITIKNIIINHGKED